MKRILSLGAGVQSTTLLLMSLRGELPRLDAAIFADTQWEPKEVYKHLEWLKEQCEVAGVPLYCGTKGDLRKDAIDFRLLRRDADGKSSMGKRYASIPLFVKNADGSQGKVKRQCTKEYKIEVIERIIRRVILGLKPRQRAPIFPVIEHWLGISMDEAQRAAYPGRLEEKVVGQQGSLFGVSTPVRRKVWVPKRWEIRAYPLLDVSLHSNRTSTALGYLPSTMTRSDCQDWLRRNYPGREIPRSACLGCPFRTNEEWKKMRDESPADWADAIDFDHSQRAAGNKRAIGRGAFDGETYVHRQLIPLDMVNLDGEGEKAGISCGVIADGFDGMCGV